MIEQISFIGKVSLIQEAETNATQIDFNKYDWPVPRVGERVKTRKGDAYLEGYVESVTWYFSNANSGPCVEVRVSKARAA